MEALRQYGAFGAAAVLGLAGFALGDYAQLAWLGAGVFACLGVALRAPRWGVLATALLGLFASGYLLYRKIDPSGAAICNVSEVVNCDKVNNSPASELLGLPIALYGTAFFLGVALAALVAKPSPGARLFQTVGLLSLVGCAYSVYLAYETWLMRTTCPFCLTIYACCFLLVGICLSAVGTEDDDAARAGPIGGLFANVGKVFGSSAFLVIAGTFVIGVLLGQGSVRTTPGTAGERIDAIARNPSPSPAPGNAAPPPSPAERLAGKYGRPRGTLELEGDEPTLGKATARFQIVEFADFGCPHCAQAFPLLHELVERYPDDVAVRFRVFPLSGACNPMIQATDRAEVCRAAMAAQCATDQGKFWEYAGTLFVNQRYLAGNAEALIAQAAQQVGLDLDKFSGCLQTPATLEQVQRDAIAGAKMQLPGTPSFFVKGLLADREQWVEVCAGPEALVQLILAAKDGVELPPPAGPCADDGHGH